METTWIPIVDGCLKRIKQNLQSDITQQLKGNKLHE